MSIPGRELFRRGLAALRRTVWWWGVAIVVFALVNVAFWPSLEGSKALEELGGMSEGVLEAFGAQGIATPAGYLDGQFFALMFPLLLSGLAVAAVTALTSGEEDGGRLELLHALPVRRRTIWLARLCAALAAVAAVAAITGGVLAASLGAFSLEEVGVGPVLGATAACAALAGFHATVAYAAGAAGASRAAAVATALGVLVVGYLADFVLPLAHRLEPLQKASPWYWSIGEQPVSDGVNPLGLLTLVALASVLVALGTLRLERRDIRSA